MVSDKKERIEKGLFASAAALCVGAVLAIFVFLIVRSIPDFGKIGVGNLLFGRNWSPDRLDTYGASLAVALYQLSGEGWYLDEAYATAVILVALVLILNLAARKCAAGLARKQRGETYG